jgi:signal transduction histidine kinase/ActR/RegA family two-component response regulator
VRPKAESPKAASSKRAKVDRKQSPATLPKAARPQKQAKAETQNRTRAAKPGLRKVSSRARGAPDRAEPSAVGMALAMFAHEVRTPLTGILAVSDLLATSDLDERERRWVETIKHSAEHLAALATLFVDAARDSKAGRVSLRKAMRRDVFDLRGLAQASADALAGRATARGLEMVADISPAVPARAIGDAVRLRAALENLIDNATKFTPAGKVGFKVGVTRAPRGKVGVAFAVSDSGIGLSLAEVRRLFKPFSQANLSITQRFGGAGLGLSSVRQLARAMGGDLIAIRRPGGGTTFTLSVVLEAVGEDPSFETGSGGDNSQAAAEPGLRLLAVEDNPFGRVVLNAILHELGHVTEFISRGEDAVARLGQGGFDAVLMDMVLPGVSGIETIRRIRKLSAPLGRIAIIGVSGRESDSKKALAAGANAFLVKPVSPRGLIQALARVVRSPRISAAANA